MPVRETTAAALGCYLARRHVVAGGDRCVFVATTGRALTYPMVNGTSHFLLRFVELLASRPSQRGPRIHDLRHGFAVRALDCAPDDRDRITQHMPPSATGGAGG